MLKRKGLPSRVEMEFEGGLTEAATAHAGVALLIELGRISSVMATAERCLPDKTCFTTRPCYKAGRRRAASFRWNRHVWQRSQQ